MIATKTYYQLIPEKVLLNLPYIEAKVKTGVSGYASDNLKEVVSIISCHVRKEEGATPLKVLFIKKLVPQGEKYLFGLMNLGIVKRSGAYVPGEVSYRYCFTDEYDSRYLSLPLHNQKLIRRIEQARIIERRRAAASVRGRAEQTVYIRKLTLDPEYLNYINSTYSADTEQYNKVMASATRIVNGDFFYSVDNTSRRFHSNLTNLPKGLRPYLRINGKPLCNLDVKNSQPYISTMILTNPSKVSWLAENSAFAMLLQNLKVTLTEDVIKYVSLVVSGQIYEFLMQEFAVAGLNLTRQETKVQVLRILFARNRDPRDETNRTARRVFRAHFPTVHKIFSKVRGKVTTGDKFSKFSRFAILLQRIESYLMLDVILKRIYRELPGVIAVTVHDSVMTGILTNDVEAVRKIIDEEMTLFVGFRPNLSIEGITESKEE